MTTFNNLHRWGTERSCRKRTDYPNPFQDIASLYMPETLEESFELAEHIADRVGPFREALRRVLAYCTTEPEIVSNTDGVVVSDSVREKYQKALRVKTIGFPSVMMCIALDRLVYGNSFISVEIGFTRYLHCQGADRQGHKCSCSVPLTQMMHGDYGFKFQNFEFCGRCPVCGYSGPWSVHDIYSTSADDLYLKRWNIHEIALLHDTYTGKSRVIWRIPGEYRAQVMKGESHVLETVPMDILRAIQNGGDIEFAPDFICHTKESVLSGVDSKGWGIPRVLRLFRQLWFLQIVHSYNEALATDYIIPKRVLSPPATGSGVPGSDPLMGMPGADFVYQMNKMVDQLRRDPSSWLVSPFALQYQALGGDASRFLPREMLEYSHDTLLTSAGVPVELYKGTLSLQAAPSALRLFESFWSDLLHENSIVLDFVVERIRLLLGWEKATAQFKKISHAEDMARIQNILNLGMQGAVSQTTALSTLGLSKKDEDRRIMDEQLEQVKLQQQQHEALEEEHQIQQLYPGGVLNAVMQSAPQPADGGMPAGGASGGGAVPPSSGLSPLVPGADPVSQIIAQAGQMPGDTLEDLYAKAQTIAQQFMSLPNRPSALRKLQSQDKQLHALVKSVIQEIESNAASEGRRAVIQQQFGQG